jgi:hypothetical protein
VWFLKIAGVLPGAGVAGGDWFVASAGVAVEVGWGEVGWVIGAPIVDGLEVVDGWAVGVRPSDGEVDGVAAEVADGGAGGEDVVAESHVGAACLACHYPVP